MQTTHILSETPAPLESYDPWLVEQFRLIANKQHPKIRAIWIGKEACAEVGYRGKLLILLHTNDLIMK